MKVNGSKFLSIVIGCACIALSAQPSLAESQVASATASAPTIRFKDDRCRVPELAPFKLSSVGTPRYALPSHWWYIVVNFNSIVTQGSGQRVRACLRVGNLDGRKIAKAITCETVGDVRVRRGVATFNGGYIACDGINVADAGEEIGIRDEGSFETASAFWMAVKGSLSPTTTEPVSLLKYERVITSTNQTTAVGNIAFNLMPASNDPKSEPKPGFVISESPLGNVQGKGLSIAVPPNTTFTGLFESVPIRNIKNDSIYSWSVFGSGLIDAVNISAPFTPISIDESTLMIGGSPDIPEDERFHGTLDFVILDPDGGGRGGGT